MMKLFEKAADILYKKYKTNPKFHKLVQPDEENEGGKGNRETRGRSIILRRETIPETGNRRVKKKCCE
jgi:hypothetical protein